MNAEQQLEKTMNKTVLIMAIVAFFTFNAGLAQSDDDKRDVSINVGLDSDDNNRESVENLIELISELDKDAAEKLSVKVEGLSDEEKLKILQRMGGDSFDFDRDDIPAGAVAVSIIAIVMVFGTPIFILVALLYFSGRRRRQKVELVNTYLQNGQEVPAHVMQGFDDNSNENFLRSGITLSTVGLGLIVGFAVAGNEVVSGIGFIPLFIGLGRLGFWYLDERKEKQAESE